MANMLKASDNEKSLTTLQHWDVSVASKGKYKKSGSLEN